MEMKCMTCGAKLMVVPSSTSFSCPNCGKTLSRCGRCRSMGRKYKCGCGFEGP